MGRPKILNENWVLTLTHCESDGEQYWECIPKNCSRPFVIHVQNNGLMYLSILRGPEHIDQEVLITALNSICEFMVDQGVRPWIRIKPKSKNGNNAFLFKVAKKAGLCVPYQGRLSQLMYRR